MLKNKKETVVRNKMTNRNDGSQFEKLVQDIELLILRHYGQTNVTSKRRYRVKGKSSIKKREVDVAFFIDLGNHKFFLAIECRDWKKKVGVSWIEQLITKRSNVKADRMVAVSKVGFTEDAKLMAEENGIELYTLSQYQSLSDDKKLLSVLLTVFYPKVFASPISLTYRFLTLNPNLDRPELSSEDKGLLLDFSKKLWIDNKRNKLISIKKIIPEMNLHWNQLLDGTETGEKTIFKKIDQKLPSNQYFFDKKFPNVFGLELVSVLIRYEIRWEPKTHTPDRIIHYRHSSDKPIIEMHAFDGKIPGREGEALFVAQVTDKDQHI